MEKARFTHKSLPKWITNLRVEITFFGDRYRCWEFWYCELRVAWSLDVHGFL